MGGTSPYFRDGSGLAGVLGRILPEVGTLTEQCPSYLGLRVSPCGRQAPCSEWGLGVGLYLLFPGLHLSSLSQCRGGDTS